MLLINRKEMQAVNFNEALDQAGLNWRVDLAPVYAQVGDQHKLVRDHFAPVRSDTLEPLPAIVGARYEIIQHADLAPMVDPVIQPLNAKIENAGFLKDGRLFFFQSKMPDSWKVGNKDLINSFLTLTGSHDGSMPLSWGFSFIRIVCQNTFMLASKDARDTLVVRHTAQAQYKIDEAQKVIKAALEYQEGVKIKAQVLAQTKVTDSQLDRIVAESFGVKVSDTDIATRTLNNMEKVKDLFETGLGIADNPEIRGTAWAAFNALTQYSDHERTVRNEENNPLARFESNLLGSSATFKRNAFEVINSVILA